MRQYSLEIDTTELFNSVFKKAYQTTGVGGLVQFTPPNLTFADSTVYYWRVSMVPTGTNPVIWNGFSFIYLPNSGTGFNQSHYYQHKKSTYTGISLNPDRKFTFDLTPRTITIRTVSYTHLDVYKRQQQATSERIEQLFDNGLGLVGYFGHSSANTFEFNLSNPELYTNTGKYPFFNVSGCSAGNFYNFDVSRLSGNMSLSEKYVLANQKGSIGFLADTHFGIPPYLNFFNTQFYACLLYTSRCV